MNGRTKEEEKIESSFFSKKSGRKRQWRLLLVESKWIYSIRFLVSVHHYYQCRFGVFAKLMCLDVCSILVQYQNEIRPSVEPKILFGFVLLLLLLLILTFLGLGICFNNAKCVRSAVFGHNCAHTHFVDRPKYEKDRKRKVFWCKRI